MQKRGFLYALTHQGTSAFATFLITVALGRMLSPEAFGIFAILIALPAFYRVPQNSFISEPIMVFGPSQFAKAQKPYYRLAIQTHFVLSAAVSAALMLAVFVALALGDGGLSLSLFGLALALPLLTLTNVTDRIFYSRLDPHIPAGLSVLQLVAVCLFGWIAISFDQITVFAAFLVLALAHGLSNVAALGALSKQDLTSEDALDAQRVRQMHIEFGRWTIGAHALYWLQTNSYTFILPIQHSLDDVAHFKAMSAAIMPAIIAFSSIGAYLLPVLRKAPPEKTTEVTRTIVLAVVGLGLVTTAAVYVLGGWFINLVYAGNYQFNKLTLLIAGCYPLFAGLSYVYGTVARAREKPEIVAKAMLLSLLIGLPIGTLLAWQFSVTGALAGQALASALASLFMVLRLRREETAVAA